MKHVAAVVQREKVYSLGFTTTNIRRELSIGFWEGKELVTVAIAHCGRDVPAVRSCVLLCSQVLSVVSLEPTIICCAGEVLISSKHWIKPRVKNPGYNIPSVYRRYKLRN